MDHYTIEGKITIGVEDINESRREIHADFPLTAECKGDVYTVPGLDRYYMGIDLAKRDRPRYSMILHRGLMFPWEQIMPAVAETLVKHKELAR